MTKVLTVRVPPELLGRLEARAASLGMGKSKYLRKLIEEDVEADGGGAGCRFVSEDLVGVYTAPEPVEAATNRRVREVMRQRNQGRRR